MPAEPRHQAIYLTFILELLPADWTLSAAVLP
jgi:hypothetical protein